MKKGGNLLKNDRVYMYRFLLCPPFWRQAAVLVVLAAFLILPITSEAVDVTGTSTTYLQYRETANGSNLLPLYEYLNFGVNKLGKENISFQFGGWVRYDLNDNEVDGKDKNSDLQYAYLSFRSAASNGVLNLGRVMVFEGVAAERVDGAYARTDLKGGFGVSAFGGVPVETDIDLPGNNEEYGARVSHQIPGLYVIGLSYLKEEKNSQDFREEEGVDLWLRPMNKVEILGKSSYNEMTSGWMQHTYNLLLGPFSKLMFNTEASWINYGDFFTGATSSAFTFQPGGPIDPNEKVSILGETVSYAFTGGLNASVDYKSYDYNIAGNATYYGGRVAYAVTGSGGAGISIHRMDGNVGRLTYDEYRVYGSKKIDKADVAVDLLAVLYDVPINGVDHAYSFSLAAGYELSERLKLGADVEYSKNPDFDRDVRTFLKLIYRFDLAYGKGKGV
jgi:hypothetical protein